MPARKDATTLRTDEVAGLLAAACSALPGRLLRQKGPAMPPQWAEVRRVVALLSDEPRRACVLALLHDEGRRLATEKVSSWNGGGAAAKGEEEG